MRSALFGHRHLHLVPVETVAEALTFLALGRDTENAKKRCVRYIVSTDDEPGGRFNEVESRLRRELKLKSAPLIVPVPSWILRCALTLSGRSDTDPYRIYDASRLQAAGFRPTVSLVSALDAYAAWYRAQSSATGAP